jgi:TetR/AcrR family transcriptional regulator, transcriptional repressor for nem operon
MKVSKARAAAHREALLAAAGTLYRERGFDAVSIADIGAASGLTHGALYGHFSSKEALQLAAVDGLFGWTAEQVRNAPDIGAVIDLYLSATHVENPGVGCPLSALGGDTARQGQAVRDDFAHGLESLIEAYATLASAGRGSAPARADAICSIATLVGAVVLARACGNKVLSDEVLAAVRARLRIPAAA